MPRKEPSHLGKLEGCHCCRLYSRCRIYWRKCIQYIYYKQTRHFRFWINSWSSERDSNGECVTYKKSIFVFRKVTILFLSSAFSPSTADCQVHTQSSFRWWVRNKKLKNVLLASPCLCVSVCPHVRAREPLNRFSLNFIFGSFTKICRHIIMLVEIGQQ
jgi:hypothetical protein